MNKSRTLSFPVTLTTAQLSYLLTIVQAPTLFGANHHQLFPENDDERAQLWQTGQQQLKRDATPKGRVPFLIVFSLLAYLSMIA